MRSLKSRPQIKQFEIWCEGYKFGDNKATAKLLGKEKSYSFENAVVILSKKLGYLSKHLNLKNLTLWGCRLYDNERKARNSFG